MTANDLHSETRVFVPVHGVKLDEPGDYGLIQVGVFDGVGVGVSLEHPLVVVLIGDVLPVERVHAVGNHEWRHPLVTGAASLRHHASNLGKTHNTVGDNRINDRSRIITIIG